MYMGLLTYEAGLPSDSLAILQINNAGHPQFCSRFLKFIFFLAEAAAWHPHSCVPSITCVPDLHALHINPCGRTVALCIPYPSSSNHKMLLLHSPFIRGSSSSLVPRSVRLPDWRGRAWEVSFTTG